MVSDCKKEGRKHESKNDIKSEVSRPRQDLSCRFLNKLKGFLESTPRTAHPDMVRKIKR